MLAGLYQLTPLKHACLAKCRTPADFIRHSWRDGSAGAFRMGLSHGIDCLGCNWLLFVLLFPLGLMNIAAMALLTALTFAEKVFPLGSRIAQCAALVLILYGALVIITGASKGFGREWAEAALERGARLLQRLATWGPWTRSSSGTATLSCRSNSMSPTAALPLTR
ncbi:MAG TPA: DUF2182 domain-containing protein [Ktedonobacteraceae bacterium]